MTAVLSRWNIVTPDVWERVAGGGPIEIVYSARRPTISGPKYLLDVEAGGAQGA